MRLEGLGQLNPEVIHQQLLPEYHFGSYRYTSFELPLCLIKHYGTQAYVEAKVRIHT
jgi:hypothetical protein